MFKRILRMIFSILGLVVGYVVAEAVVKVLENFKLNILSNFIVGIIFFVFCILFFGIIFYFISPIIYNKISIAIDSIGKSVQKLSVIELVYGTMGIFIALIIASLVGIPFTGIFKSIHPALGAVIFVLWDLIAAIIGAEICVRKKDEISSVFFSFKKQSLRERKQKVNNKNNNKVLDTSVIIDGRIFDLCKTGFIEGTLVIPSFVLDELRHISDSSDVLKRNRGRRGLDILNKIQKELDIETQIWEGDFPEINEVDSKLLKLGQLLGGKVITNDFNLNKVAEFQGVPVLNINELANAIKPVLLPGEEMKVIVIKDGKESTQGVAYLDDGTMIVVEGGRKFIGEEIFVVVTSVLQTAAGRMIFAKPKES